MNKKNKEIIDEIRALLNKLDFSEESPTVTGKVAKSDKYEGCMGGLLFLISEGYFNEPKNRQEIIAKLVEMGRYYKPALVSMNLKNLITQKTLTKIGKAGTYKFVIRK